ncbi:hypothetical protein IL306_014333 [Fusarium sp. DS 682]|nr:hypothetical protein IL306_014333 [Fusarium sp. DS 682]
MPQEQHTQSSDKQSSSSSGYKPQTHYGFIRDNYDNSKSKFMYSHGLKMVPGDFEEGKAIIDAYIKYDKYENEPSNKQK